jgi:hypothetical protein
VTAVKQVARAVKTAWLWLFADVRRDLKDMTFPDETPEVPHAGD